MNFNQATSWTCSALTHSFSLFHHSQSQQPPRCADIQPQPTSQQVAAATCPLPAFILICICAATSHRRYGNPPDLGQDCGLQWPHARIDERGVLRYKSSTVSRARCASCWKTNTSPAEDRWQQFLHLQHVSVILPVDFIPRLNENEVGTFVVTAAETVTESLKVRRMRRRRL